MTRMLRRDLLPAGKWAYPSRTPGSFPLPVDRYCQRSGHPSVKPFSTAEKEEGERERGRPRERAGLKKGLIHDSFALLMIQSKTERGGEHRKILSSLFTLSYAEIFHVFFRMSSFPIKMLATDAKTQKIEPDPIFFYFYDERKFRRQCVNVIDTMWGHIYFLTCTNFGWEFRTQCANTFSPN